MKNHFPCSLTGSLIFVLTLISAAGKAQPQGKDLVKENYIIGNSSELFTIRTQDDTVEFRIFDANGNINEGGLIEKEHKLLEGYEWQILNFASPVTVLSGDFDGDPYTDVVAAWEATDSNVAMYIPKIDPSTLKILSDTRIHLVETGAPEMYAGNNSLPTLISLKKGQFDNDPNDEMVLAYMARSDNPEGGSVYIAIYDMESGTPELKTSASNIVLHPDISNAPNGLSRGSIFDVASGDFNQDGIDELVLVTVTPEPAGDDYGWRLDAYLYQMEDGKLNYLFKTSEAIYSDDASSSDFLKRIAVVCGNFDNDFYEDIAVSYQVVEVGNGDSRIYLRALKATTSGFGIMGNQEHIGGSNGSNGWPITIEAGDADYNGFDEVHLAVRNTVSSYQFDENMNQVKGIPSPIAASGLNTDKNTVFRNIFTASDMDIAENDSLKTEIAVIDSRGLNIYQKNPEGYFDEIFEIEDLIASGITAGDFDGDALRLGKPRSQTLSEIIQPLLYLSTPPVHFDIFGEDVFDLQDCYPVYESGENCATSSVYYEKIESQTIESTTEIRSTWTKTSLPIMETPLPGHYAPDFYEIADRVINKEFNKIYGGEEVERRRSSSTFTFSSRSETTEDDNIQCLVTNYELIEYPLYSGDRLVKYVMLIEPDMAKTRLQWLPFRSSAARNFHPNHEVGNILSYPKTTNLPKGARTFGAGGYNGGIDTWTVSPSTVGNWNMKFSSETITEREATSTEKISNDIRGDVGGGVSGVFAYGEAHVSFEYLDNKTYEEFNSTKTTIKESSEINISIGKINTGLIGTKTYMVTPFIYWDVSGALILDYAVEPDLSDGVASWWEEKYSAAPDLTFNLPWRYAGSRGLGGADNDLQSKQTYDITLSKTNIQTGDTTDIYARIQNYSNVAANDVSVQFFLGDPADGGVPIVNTEGRSEVMLDQINAREPVMARLFDWVVPTQIGEEARIYALIDAGNTISEVHENNNKAWNLAVQGYNVSQPTAVDQSHVTDNATGILVSVYPNPTKEVLNFNYSLLATADIEITIYNLQGMEVKKLLSDSGNQRNGAITLGVDNLKQGMYLYTFQAGDQIESGRFVILK